MNVLRSHFEKICVIAQRMLWFLMGMCLCCSVSAQELSLYGPVEDMKGDGLPDACVIVVGPETTEVLAVTLTDSVGRYVLKSLPSRFILNVTHIGHESVNLRVDGEAGFEDARIIRMQASDMQIDEAIVTADIPRIEREVDKFVMRGVAASPFAKGSSTYNFLRFMPMVEVRPDGGISILGKADAGIRIDGRRIGSGQMAEQMLKGIPASEIDRIEVIPVTGSSHSAESRGGIINVVLKKRADEGVRLILTAEDRQRYYNSPSGVLFMDWSGRKLALTAGLTTSWNQLRQESDESYDYMNTGLATMSETIMKTGTFNAGGYVNLDYRIAERHRLGAQMSLSSTDYCDVSSSVSCYGRIGSEQIDSVYVADVRTDSPDVNLNWTANLNYAFDTDNRGSRLIANIDFAEKTDTRRIKSLYSRNYGTSTGLSDDFVQRTANGTRVFGVRVDYEHCFNGDNILRAGVGAYGGKVDNDFFYGIRSGDNYVSDAPDRSNRFIYTDYDIAGYVNFYRVWSEKLETEIGVRAELYRAWGIEQTNSGTVKRNEFDIFPSLSLLYSPSDVHEFSLDFSSSVMRPYYGMLNPFITWTSPYSYTQNNPDLRSSKGYELMFNYILHDDYMLTLDYYYDTDLWTEFTLPSGNITRRYMDNYGDSHALDILLSVSKSLFRSRLNLSAEAKMGYDRTYGAVDGRQIDIRDLKYGITLKGNLALSKKHNWYLDLKYQYSSKSRSAAFDLSASQQMEIYLLKQFRRATLSIGAYDLLLPSVTTSRTFQDYGFTVTGKRYVTGVVTFSYMFGNSRTRSVSENRNDSIADRMQ